MSERIFTFFDGPDAGRTFVLGDQPITLGREKGRDVVLNDDRASRLHARLLPDGDGAIIADAGSSNGTFVNGAMVREQKLAPGDVIVIGSNSFVFGREAPSAAPPEPPEASAANAPPRAPGHRTHFLPDAAAAPALNLAPAHLAELLETLLESAQPAADARGIRLAVESALAPDDARVDALQLYRALSGLLALLLDQWPERRERQPGDSAAPALALRLGPDLARGGFVLAMVCVGMSAPRERIAALGDAEEIAAARGVVMAHGGSLEILPADAPDTFARLRMPLGPPDTNRATVIRPGRADEKR